MRNIAGAKFNAGVSFEKEAQFGALTGLTRLDMFGGKRSGTAAETPTGNLCVFGFFKSLHKRRRRKVLCDCVPRPLFAAAARVASVLAGWRVNDEFNSKSPLSPVY